MERDAAGRRRYTEKDVSWIQFIKRLKQTGMPIKQIKAYAALRYEGDATLLQRLHLLESHRLGVLEEKEKWETNLNKLEEKIQVYKDLIVNTGHPANSLR
ncbi:MerR family transcriptional regulator [Paenibacillus durus]|uniref:MerR family transcriptional regulator n=1 Tax=Paenibacillus durus TaxID=44251 RepID=UPI0004B29DF8|nr:MerR family transcriptional regulator [Paenibacillus durus]